VPQGPPFSKVANLEELLNKGESSKQVSCGEGQSVEKVKSKLEIPLEKGVNCLRETGQLFRPNCYMFVTVVRELEEPGQPREGERTYCVCDKERRKFTLVEYNFVLCYKGVFLERRVSLPSPLTRSKIQGIRNLRLVGV
jgi:hypothetical protein